MQIDQLTIGLIEFFYKIEHPDEVLLVNKEIEKISRLVRNHFGLLMVGNKFNGG